MTTGQHEPIPATIVEKPCRENGWYYVVDTATKGRMNLGGLGAPMGDPVGRRGTIRYMAYANGAGYFWQAEPFAHESDYLTYTQTRDTGTTKVYAVLETISGARLATIKWLKRWRGYVLYTARGTIWPASSLTDVAAFIQHLHDQHELGPPERG